MKHRLKRLLVYGAVSAAVFIFSARMATAQATQPSHADRISRYEGPQTCRACHENAVKEVAASLHYQQAAEPRFLVDWEKGNLAGMTLSFWAAPNTVVKHNWIGILQPKDASKPAQPGGCGQCHPGLGAFPTIGKPTEADFRLPDLPCSQLSEGGGQSRGSTEIRSRSRSRCPQSRPRRSKTN